MRIKKIKNKKAFSLVEVLIVVFIMSVAFVTFYTVSVVGTKYIIESKNRLAAVALANEKMEIIRNLPYDNIGTVGGFVEGDIDPDEDVIANGHSYNVKTSIRYIDDSLDGEYPSDTLQDDYKVVKIVISWTDSNGQTQEVYSLTRFVPPGLETTSGGAPWAINVSKSDGSGVPQATVHIINNDVSPAINTTLQTDNTGYILISSAPESSGGYEISVSKNGYETIDTLDSSPTFIPIYQHASVVLGSLNTYNFTQDQTADLVVKTYDYQDNPVGDISFLIEGGRIIGHDDLGNAIYSTSSTTDTTGSASGEKEYPNSRPGNYNITMLPDAQYEFIDFDPSISPAVLTSGTDLAYTLRVASKSTNALFVKITDDMNNPIISTTATLTDILTGTEIFTDKAGSARGIIFYPDGITPLAPGNYELEIKASGFQTETKTITITEGLITEESIQLTAS